MPDFGASEIALISSVLGGSLLGGITAPEGQELSSFEGEGELDPKIMMGGVKSQLDDLLNAVIARANEPVTLRTTVNPLPSFVGGALPMAISAPGQDANRLNPNLRTSPGAGISRRRLGENGEPPGGRDPWQRPPGDHGPSSPEQALSAIELILGQGGR